MAIAGLFSEEEEGRSWISALEMNKQVPSMRDPFSLYIAALYWSLMTITSVGYGDIVPQTNIEYCAVTAMMLMGCCTWAHIIGSLCAVISNLDAEKMAHEQRMDAVLVMARDRFLPRDLRLRLRRFFQHSRRLHRMAMHTQVTSLMSPQLQGEVALSVTLKYLREIYFLKNTEGAFIVSLAKALQLHFFPPSERIAPEGHAAGAVLDSGLELKHRSLRNRGMQSGSARSSSRSNLLRVDKAFLEDGLSDHYRNPQELEHVKSASRAGPPMTMLERGIASRRGVLSAGAVWHEDALIVSQPALRDPLPAISLTFCSVYTLSRHDFHYLIDKGDYPLAKSALRRASWRLVLTRVVLRAAEEAQRQPPRIRSFSTCALSLLNGSAPMFKEEKGHDLASSLAHPLDLLKPGSSEAASGLTGAESMSSLQGGNAVAPRGPPAPQELSGRSGTASLPPPVGGTPLELRSTLEQRLSGIELELRRGADERAELRRMLVQLLGNGHGPGTSTLPSPADSSRQMWRGASSPHSDSNGYGGRASMQVGCEQGVADDMSLRQEL
mmetsp:Transcript_132671/g.296733  ORF Transcript_132671/g.296733 Transcript_132671/m.296733 type:complete len:553 (+) Transcript_132671:3-1661(+)